MLVDFSNQDFMAISYLESLGGLSSRMQAKQILLSRLDPESQQKTSTLRNLYKSAKNSAETSSNKVFLLSNNDILIVGKGLDTPSSERIISGFLNEVRTSFPSDSFVTAASHTVGGFFESFDLSRDLRHLIRRCIQISPSQFPLEENHEKIESIERGFQQKDGTRSRKQPMTIDILDRLSQMLDRTDIGQVMRSQGICHIDRDGDHNIIFNENYISILDLAQSVSENLDISGSQWLFMHLTQTLDRRLLPAISQRMQSRPNTGALSLNLNVTSISQQEFRHFNSLVAPEARRTIMIEFHLIDILANLEAYHRAREYLQELGYVVAVDGVKHELLRFADRQQLKADFVKLIASGKFRALSRESLMATVRTVDADDPQRYILTRCDDFETVEFGRQMKIVLFQGFYVDALMRSDPKATKPNESLSSNSTLATSEQDPFGLSAGDIGVNPSQGGSKKPKVTVRRSPR